MGVPLLDPSVRSMPTLSRLCRISRRPGAEQPRWFVPMLGRRTAIVVAVLGVASSALAGPPFVSDDPEPDRLQALRDLHVQRWYGRARRPRWCVGDRFQLRRRTGPSVDRHDPRCLRFSRRKRGKLRSGQRGTRGQVPLSASGLVWSRRQRISPGVSAQSVEKRRHQYRIAAFACVGSGGLAVLTLWIANGTKWY
jgi:hypothetical protein